MTHLVHGLLWTMYDRTDSTLMHLRGHVRECVRKSANALVYVYHVHMYICVCMYTHTHLYVYMYTNNAVQMYGMVGIACEYLYQLA